MFHLLAARRVRQVFDRLSVGDYEPALAGLAPDAHHRFAGEDPLGGERYDAVAVRRWFERLYRLFPALRFTIAEVAVSGPPWAMTVTVQWRADVVPRIGPSCVNVGAHVLRVRRGRVGCLHAYPGA